MKVSDAMRSYVWAVMFSTFAWGVLPPLGWTAERSLAELLEQLQYPQQRGERLRAAEALAEYGPHAVPALCRLLQADEALVRSYAAVALVRIGPRAEAAVPDLIQLAGNKAEAQDLREVALVALGQIGPPAAPAIPVLRAVLNEASAPLLQQEAISALATIATPDSVAVLVDLLEHGDRHRQQAVLLALSAQGAKAKSAAADLLAFGSRHADSELCDRVFLTVTALGREAVVDLLPYLQADAPATRRRAALALSRLGPQAIAAVPALCAVLHEEADVVRFWAAKALGNIGPDAAQAIGPLRHALQDADPNVRWEAATALAKIDPAAISEHDWRRLLSDPDPGVRQRAAAIRSARV